MWHTHPKICYTKYECYIGWPSGTDMSNIIYKYTEGSVAHLVFTIEGIYLIQLTSEMMILINFINDINTTNWIVLLIKSIYDQLEKYRQYSEKDLFTDYTDIKWKIDNFLFMSQNYSLLDMLEIYKLGQYDINIINEIQNIIFNYGVSNFPVFSLKLISNESSLIDTLSFIPALQHGYCPLPFYENDDWKYSLP